MSFANKTLSQVIKSYVNAFQEGLMTALPAEIDSVDNLESKQTIDCHVTLKFLFPDDDILENQVIVDVPVLFPSGGSGMLSFPLKVGDPVLLVFSSREIDEWRASSGGDVTPKFRRFHSQTDAIAIPCVYPEKLNLNPNPNDTELKFADTFITLRENGDLDVVTGQHQNVTVNGNNTVTITGNSDVTVQGDSKLDVLGDADISVAGTTTGTFTGDVTATMASNLTANITGNADVTTGGNMTATVGGDATANITGSASVTAADATVTAPTINLAGNVTITGNLTVTGSGNYGTTLTAGGNVTGTDFYTGALNFLGHIHTGDSGGDTSGPK